jgi:hypothetical protein
MALCREGWSATSQLSMAAAHILGKRGRAVRASGQEGASAGSSNLTVEPVPGMVAASAVLRSSAFDGVVKGRADGAAVSPVDEGMPRGGWRAGPPPIPHERSDDSDWILCQQRTPRSNMAAIATFRNTACPRVPREPAAAMRRASASARASSCFRSERRDEF